MTPRKERFPRPSFDHHADDMATYDHNGRTLIKDVTISKRDRAEGRPWVLEADIATTNAILHPHVPVTRDAAPVEPYQIRPARHTAAWVTGYLLIVVLALLVVAVVVAS